jgi:uncharacterized protein (TIGR03437 family)
MSISALADLYLIDQPSGTGVLANTTASAATGGCASALAPYSAPPQVPITLTAGQTLHLNSIANLDYAGLTGVGPSPGKAAFGLSATSAPDGLIGVFVGDRVDSTKTPADLAMPNPSTATQTPALQQVFYAGGLFGAANVVVPAGATRLFIAPVGGGLGNIGVIYQPVVTVTPDNSAAPQISAGGIVTNAGFLPGPVAPGSMVAIFGSDLGPQTLASNVPLTTTLGGTQVFFDSIPAPLFYVSPTQIVAEVPYEVPFSAFSALNPVTSPNAPTALVTVVRSGVPSLPQPVVISSMAVQMFTASGGVPIITDNNTGQLVSSTAAASRGDTITLWATGAGYTALDAATGSPAPNAASVALLPLAATLKNSATGAVTVLVPQYTGLAPGFIGLDQINIQIPANTPPGASVLQIVTPGFATPAAYTIGIQ